MLPNIKPNHFVDVLDCFIARERDLGLWLYEDPSGFPLWALLRNDAARKHFYSYFEMGNFDNQFFEKTFSFLKQFTLLPEYAFALHRILRPRGYDALFIGSPHPYQRRDKTLVDFRYGQYLSSYSNPLFFQYGFSRACVRYSGMKSNVYHANTLFLIPLLFSYWPTPRHSWEDEFLEKAKEMYPADTPADDCSIRRAIRYARGGGGGRWFARQMERVMTSRTAFIGEASYLSRKSMLTFWLKKHGFTVCEVQHGTLNKAYAEYNYPLDPDILPALKRVLPDRLHTYYPVEGLRTPSRVIYDGEPRIFDEIRSDYPGLSENAHQILVLSGGGRSPAYFAELVGALARRFPCMSVIFKLHPMQDQTNPALASLRDIPNVRVSRDSNTYHLLFESRYVIGYYTAALEEAVILGKKNVYRLSNDFLDEWVGEYVPTFEDLVRRISEADAVGVAGQSVCPVA